MYEDAPPPPRRQGAETEPPPELIGLREAETWVDYVSRVPREPDDASAEDRLKRARDARLAEARNFEQWKVRVRKDDPLLVARREDVRMRELIETMGRLRYRTYNSEATSKAMEAAYDALVQEELLWVAEQNEAMHIPAMMYKEEDARRAAAMVRERAFNQLGVRRRDDVSKLTRPWRAYDSFVLGGFIHAVFNWGLKELGREDLLPAGGYAATFFSMRWEARGKIKPLGTKADWEKAKAQWKSAGLKPRYDAVRERAKKPLENKAVAEFINAVFGPVGNQMANWMSEDAEQYIIEHKLDR